MKNIRVLIFVTFLVLELHAAEYLLLLPDLDSKSRKQYTIIRQISNEYLIVADENLFVQIRKERTSFLLLDENPRENIYFIIANSSQRDKEQQLFRFGTLLKRYSAFFLFKTQPQFIDSVRMVPLRMEQLSFNPWRYENQSIIPTPRAMTPNPLISKIISDISIDTMRAYVKKLQSFPTRKSSSNENKTVVATWISDMLKSLCDSVYLESVSTSCGPNIIGIRKGDINPSLTNYCVLGGHFDAIIQGGKFNAAGADDNGTGTAAVLECARVFKKYRFENTIRFVLFNGEEAGLVGSKMFVSNMSKNKHTIIGGAITYDMLGHSTSNSKNLIQIEGTDQDNANKVFVTEYMQGIVDTYTKMKTYQYLQGFGSDHTSFWPSGYVGMLCIEREYEHPAYHKDFDTLDCPNGLNDMELFTNISKTGSAAIADLAKPMNTSEINAQSELVQVSSSTMHVSYLKNGTISIAITEPEKNLSIVLFSTNGKLVHQFKYSITSNQTITLNRKILRYSSGIYVLQINGQKTQIVQKIALL